MKRVLLVSIILILCGVVVLWLWPNERTITNFPPHGRRVVAFGDSLVAGVGDSGGDGFVEDLERRFHISIINEGVPGDTSAAARKRVDDVLAHNPDIALLLIGGNDAIKRVDTATTKRNISAIISRLQDDGVVVILLGVRGGIFGGGYANMYEELAHQHGTFYVPDVLDNLIGNGDLMSDRVHPNARGYERIADRVAPVLEKNLNAVR